MLVKFICARLPRGALLVYFGLTCLFGKTQVVDTFSLCVFSNPIAALEEMRSLSYLLAPSRARTRILCTVQATHEKKKSRMCCAGHMPSRIGHDWERTPGACVSQADASSSSKTPSVIMRSWLHTRSLLLPPSLPEYLPPSSPPSFP